MSSLIRFDGVRDMCGDDIVFFNKLLQIFREELKECLDELSSSFINLDTESVANVCHKIKGMSLAMCCDSVSQYSLILEKSAISCYCTKNEYILLVISILDVLRETI